MLLGGRMTAIGSFIACPKWRIMGWEADNPNWRKKGMASFPLLKYLARQKAVYGSCNDYCGGSDLLNLHWGQCDIACNTGISLPACADQ